MRIDEGARLNRVGSSDDSPLEDGEHWDLVDQLKGNRQRHYGRIKGSQARVPSHKYLLKALPAGAQHYRWVCRRLLC